MRTRRHGRYVVAEIGEVREDAVLGAGERRRVGVGERHVMAGEREHLRTLCSSGRTGRPAKKMLRPRSVARRHARSSVSSPSSWC